MKKLLIVSLIAGFASFGAQAESNSTTDGSAPAARLNFSITIPKVMLLQVGSAGGTQDTINFNVGAGTVGNGTAVASTGGNLDGGAAVAVRLMSNVGKNLVLSGQFSDLKGTTSPATLNWSDITVTSDAATTLIDSTSSAAAIAHPVMPTASTGNGVSQAIQGANAVVKQEAKWTFKYNNSKVALADTYKGTATYTLTAQ